MHNLIDSVAVVHRRGRVYRLRVDTHGLHFSGANDGQEFISGLLYTINGGNCRANVRRTFTLGIGEQIEREGATLPYVAQLH